MKRIVPILALFLCFPNIVKADDLTFFDALAKQESGNKPLSPHPDTNGKLVIGYFQISKAYWEDAFDFDNSIGGSWEQCQNDKGYAEAVILAYMSRYVPWAVEQHNYEVISRVHNGGCLGYKHKCTVGYWKSVKRKMEDTK